MELANKKIGFAMCGSFCTFKKVIAELEKLVVSLLSLLKLILPPGAPYIPHVFSSVPHLVQF